MSTKVYGTILARNVKTGRMMDVRPDMLEHPGNHWEVVSKSELDRKAEIAEKESKILAEAVESSTVHKVEKPTDDVILTAKGEPYKTEQAAKNAMSKKDLSSEEYVVFQQDEGAFIIKRI